MKKLKRTEMRKLRGGIGPCIDPTGVSEGDHCVDEIPECEWWDVFCWMG